jgi:hypothetical protein
MPSGWTEEELAENRALDVFDNHNLFSNHFLENRLSDFDEWQEDAAYRETYKEIKSLYDDNKSLIERCTNNEAELERVFIRPILELLGFSFTVQASIQDSAKRPDYALFKDEEDKRAVYEEDSPDFYAKAVCVADAKAWDRDLDKKTGMGTFTNQNPSYQIDYYLRETGKEWGILTNGRKWRLYKEEESHRLDTYFEVDLVECLERGPESFKYFYFFFRRHAFVGGDDAFLNRVYSQSATYSQSIGENLEDNVYKALLWMVKGYFAVGTNKLEKTKENLETVYANSLIFLYRLIFVLYLESKGFLQSERIPYQFRNYDITRFVDTILEEMDNDTLNPYGGLHAYKLNQIFNLIDKGSRALGIPRNVFYIPAYNGGLFSDEKHPFISFTKEEGKKIQDRYLARVVDFLTRPESPEHKGKGRIDYADLSIRHLGGIYEGLLEYKLRLAEEDLVPVRKSGSLVYMPLDEAKEKNKRYTENEIIREGEIYIATDKGERKATGSYYTPDYIVQYIVENTVEPVLEDKLEDCTSVEEKREAILSTKVLDPAMGSGHFLVEATDFIASRLAEVTEPEKDKRDIDLARREVVKHCIYGVDLNHLAVELAKLSLWIATLSQDKPLTFLDHHLKVGNSLIGADLYDLNRHPEEEPEEKPSGSTGQRTLDDMFGEAEGPVDIKRNMHQLLQMYRRIMERKEEKPDDIQAQTEIFHDLMDHQFRRRFHVLADVYTSYYFGNDFTTEQYHALLRELPPGSNWNDVAGQDWVRAASNSVDDPIEGNLAEEKHFFHWQLEFPEIFFDIDTCTEKANPGFDAVIGNPPYFSISNLTDNEKNYLQHRYQKVYAGNSDILYYFLSLLNPLVGKNRYLAFIVARYFLKAKYAKKLRSYLSNNTRLSKMVDFLNYQVFGRDVNVLACIAILKHSVPSEQSTTTVLRITDDKASRADIADALLHNDSELFEEFESPSPYSSKEDWNLIPVSIKNMERKFVSISLPLGDIATIVQSMETGKNRVLAPSIDTIREYDIEDELVHLVAKSGSIKRYEIEKENRRIIWTHDIELSNYPNLKKYLLPYKEELAKRYDIRTRDADWWDISNPRNANLFLGDYPRILVPFMATGNKFCVDTEKHLNDGGDIRAIFFDKEQNISPYYVCAILNSKAAELYHKSHSKLKGGGCYEYYENKLSQFPIRKINFNASQKDRQALMETAKERYHQFLKKFNTKPLLDFIDDHLPKDENGEFIFEEEQSDVVHDFLAFLAEQMIEMKKQKQQEMEGFLDWLEGTLGLAVEDMKLKTKIREYHLYKWDEFLGFLKRNKKDIDALDITTRNAQETIKKEFETSLEKLNPLLQKIRKTDELIDQIVYRLYGLTDEEIAIVEESIQR